MLRFTIEEAKLEKKRSHLSQHAISDFKAIQTMPLPNEISALLFLPFYFCPFISALLFLPFYFCPFISALLFLPF